MNSQIAERFHRNVARVRDLVAIYDERSGRGQGRRSAKASDVLRAAVVLLHASVEDVLRSLERRTLPRAGSELLNSISLVGTSRAGKFQLGELSKHRGKTIDEVIDESVDEHLQGATYNNASEMVGVLRRLGANPELFQDEIAPVARMMKRRHQIVHRADRDESTGSGHHGTSALAKSQVVEWIDAVDALVLKIFDAVPDIDGRAP